MKAPSRVVPLILSLFAIVAVVPAAQGAGANGSPLTMETALQHAFEDGPTLAATERAIEKDALAESQAEVTYNSKWRLEGAVAGMSGGSGARGAFAGSGKLGPGVGWSVSVEQGVKDGALPGTGIKDGLSLSTGITVSLWPPAGDGADWQGLLNAREVTHESDLKLQSAQNGVVIAVTKAYSNLQFANERLAIAEEAVQAAARSLDLTKSRRTAGRASDADVVGAEIDMLEAQISASEKADEAASLRRNLADLVSIAPADLEVVAFDPEAFSVEALDRTLPPLETAVARAKEHSLDLRSKRRTLKSAQQSLAAAERDNGIDLSLSGGISAANGSDTSWNVMVDGTYALGDGGAAHVRLQKAKIAVEEAEKTLSDAEEALQARVRDAIDALQSDLEAIRVKEKVENLRKLEMSILEKQATLGLVTEQALADQKLKVRTALLDRAGAVSAYRIDRLELEDLMGMPVDR